MLCVSTPVGPAKRTRQQSKMRKKGTFNKLTANVTTTRGRRGKKPPARQLVEEACDIVSDKSCLSTISREDCEIELPIASPSSVTHSLCLSGDSNIGYKQTCLDDYTNPNVHNYQDRLSRSLDVGRTMAPESISVELSRSIANIGAEIDRVKQLQDINRKEWDLDLMAISLKLDRLLATAPDQSQHDASFGVATQQHGSEIRPLKDHSNIPSTQFLNLVTHTQAPYCEQGEKPKHLTSEKSCKCDCVGKCMDEKWGKQIDILRDTLLVFLDSFKDFMELSLSTLESKLENVILKNSARYLNVLDKLSQSVWEMRQKCQPSTPTAAGINKFQVNTVLLQSERGEIQVVSSHVDTIQQVPDHATHNNEANSSFPTSNFQESTLKAKNLDHNLGQATQKKASANYLKWLETKNPAYSFQSRYTSFEKLNNTRFVTPYSHCDIESFPVSSGRKRILVIGDSHVRNLRPWKKLGDTVVWTYPGLKAEQLTDKLSLLLQNEPENLTVVLCVGGNNVEVDTPSVIVQHIKNAVLMVRKLKPGAQVICCSMLPQPGKTSKQYADKMFDTLICTNSELFRMCSSDNVGFVCVWNQVLDGGGYFARDGVHLTRLGKSILSGEISRAIINPTYRGNWGL